MSIRHRTSGSIAVASLFALALSGCGADEDLTTEPTPASTASFDPAPDPAPDPTAEPTATNELDSEAFLEEFATAWGAQDLNALAGLATGDVIEIVQEAGAGEVGVVWDASYCDLDAGASESSCESLFTPEGQTECCAQIWIIGFAEQADGALNVTSLTFAGDAG